MGKIIKKEKYVLKLYEKPQIEIILIKSTAVVTDSDDIHLPFDPFMLD